VPDLSILWGERQRQSDFAGEPEGAGNVNRPGGTSGPLDGGELVGELLFVHFLLLPFFSKSGANPGDG